MTHTSSLTQFSEFFASLHLATVPGAVVEKAKLALVDTLGCLAAGNQTAPAAALRHISSMFDGGGNATLVGLAEPVGMARALYCNTRTANLLDFDETYPVGVHFGSAAVMAAITAAEGFGRTASDLIVGIVAGYEAGARIAASIGPMVDICDGEVCGFSPIWGVAAPVVIAACVAFGRTVGADSRTLGQALGIAGSNIPLPIGAQWSSAMDLPDVKYCDAGWCAVAGLHGLQSAQAGLTGFDDIFSRNCGIVAAYAPTMPRPDLLLEALGHRWHLDDLTFKPWPCCRFMHAPLSALSRLISRYRPVPDAIDEIVIGTNPLANSRRFRNSTPITFSSYQFSYPHVVAMMILGVPPGPRWFDPEVSESTEALAVRLKVKIEEHPEAASFASAMVDNQIRKMPGSATIKAGSRTWAQQCDYADGDPWSPESTCDAIWVMEKFRSQTCVTDISNFMEFINSSEQVHIDFITDFIRNLIPFDFE